MTCLRIICRCLRTTKIRICPLNFFKIWKFFQLDKLIEKTMSFLKWLFLIKEKDDAIHENKLMERYGNFIRIILPFIFLIIYLFEIFFTIKDIKFVILVLSILIFILIRIYWEWIKKIWHFIQSDKIIKYFFLIFVPIIIYFIGHHFWFTKPEAIQTNPTIESLSSFYSTLFAAIAVLVGIAGLAAWRIVKDAEKIKEELKKNSKDINTLKLQNDLADWAKEKFEDLKNDKSKSNLILDFDVADYKNLSKLKNYFDKDWTRNACLKILFAQDTLSHTESKYYYLSYLKIEKIYDSLLIDTSLKQSYKNKEFLELLYHEMGLLYWKWYKSVKKEEMYNFDCKYLQCKIVNQSMEPLDSKFFVSKSKIAKTFTEERTPFKLLFFSIKFYLQSANILTDIKKETWGNIILPMIELLKYHTFLINNNICFFKESYSSKDSLKENIEYFFKKLECSTTNNYNLAWDKLRFEYYTKEKILEHKDFDKIISNINTINDKNFFLRTLEEEIKEKPPCFDGGKNGFPCDNKNIKYCRKKLDEKKLN